MIDYWPYLATSNLNLRFEKAVSMIGSIKDKVILDLNCGRAGMLQYLSEDFTQYIGNDINQEFLEIARKWKNGPVSLKIALHCLPDDKIMDHLTKVDIFMCFGISVENNSIESRTSFETFKKVIEKFLPETVVCETWDNYEKDYKTISKRADFLKPFNYKEVGSFLMTVAMLRTLKVYRRE